jgi:SAM-dependent methyltransferase
VPEREIIDSRIFGPSAPALGWVPAPRYWLRRRRVLQLLRHVPHGTLLEIGCGAGALLSEARRLGFDVYAIETSAEACKLARKFTGDPKGHRIREAPGKDWPDRFDLVAAFEVLEHIEDDVGALRKWRDFLEPGGQLLLSVPAHQRMWNASDELAGHYRRYGRKDLSAAFVEAGLELVHCEFYGYPLANVSERLRVRYASKTPTKGKVERTALSGIERKTETLLWPMVANPLGAGLFLFADWMQRLFLDGERGNGILAIARRP